METSEVGKKEFWTFVVSKSEIETTQGPSDIVTVLRVEGYFLYITIVAEKTGKDIRVFHLTPMGEPLRFEVPPWFMAGKYPEDITGRQVMESFAKLFSAPFELVPPPPMDVKWEKIPPSRREKLKRAHTKTVKATFGMPKE